MKYTKHRTTSFAASLVQCFFLYVIFSYLIVGGCFFHCNSKVEQASEILKEKDKNKAVSSPSKVKQKTAFEKLVYPSVEEKDAQEVYSKYYPIAKYCSDDFRVAPLILPNLLRYFFSEPNHSNINSIIGSFI